MRFYNPFRPWAEGQAAVKQFRAGRVQVWHWCGVRGWGAQRTPVSGRCSHGWELNLGYVSVYW